MNATERRISELLGDTADSDVAKWSEEQKAGIMSIMAARVAMEHVCALLMAMDKWATDEDGIHPDAWDAYEAAREFIGQPVPPNLDGDDDITYRGTKPLAPFAEVAR